MTNTPSETHPRRIYPLDAHQLSEEQIAVTFAMTSRRPEPFDQIAEQVSQEKAADFHERWVLGYGHASVAEHAVVHLAVENISRLACDTLEDNRLASYTEKSSRYQLLPRGYYFVPEELAGNPDLAGLYRQTCDHLFQCYHRLVDGCMEHLREVGPQREGERESAYTMRLRRKATDNCRAVLPAATLTNVGMTANARVLEHAISKLLSSELSEERQLGEELREQGRKITPTLIKYADDNLYLRGVTRQQYRLSQELALLQNGAHRTVKPERRRENVHEGSAPIIVRLLDWDQQAEEKLATALLYRQSVASYDEIWRRVLTMDAEERREIIDSCVSKLGPHDAPVREFELVEYTFEFLMDYGAYREFKRHRMQSYIPQPPTVAHGYTTPVLIADAGLAGEYREALDSSTHAYQRVYEYSPQAAPYLVTHAHYRRVLARMNLRECYHLFKLRTSKLAHFSIRGPMLEAMKLTVGTHPQLFRYLRLRDYPVWWPFSQSEGS
ncbi:MAG TPA: FAD-dependent thymidylate synthase [Dehalococcoidia bacterium]|nr:FAD-dependent thymidylate synthase [Dehalococcoidia bacterium]